jgi:NTE family protein
VHDDPDVRFATLGTGAVEALAEGPQGARASLETFWRKVSEAAKLSPFQRTPLDVLLGRWTLDSPRPSSSWI